MLHSNGQGASLDEHSESTADDTRKVSKVKVLLTPTQAEFIDFILFHGVLELSKSLKLIHDLALYHSDISLDTSEKSALFDLKILWENFEQIGNEF